MLGCARPLDHIQPTVQHLKMMQAPAGKIEDKLSFRSAIEIRCACVWYRTWRMVQVVKGKQLWQGGASRQLLQCSLQLTGSCDDFATQVHKAAGALQSWACSQVHSKEKRHRRLLSCLIIASTFAQHEERPAMQRRADTFDAAPASSDSSVPTCKDSSKHNQLVFLSHDPCMHGRVAQASVHERRHAPLPLCGWLPVCASAPIVGSIAAFPMPFVRPAHAPLKMT